METVEKIKRLENSKIPKNYNYKNIKSLSTEAVEKLKALKPLSIGQASRISGVSPSDVSILMVHMKK
jgi:tRNA uridine 5-carboxymethylaminomethyl modification enzyme